MKKQSIKRDEVNTLKFFNKISKSDKSTALHKLEIKDLERSEIIFNFIRPKLDLKYLRILKEKELLGDPEVDYIMSSIRRKSKGKISSLYTEDDEKREEDDADDESMTLDEGMEDNEVNVMEEATEEMMEEVMEGDRNELENDNQEHEAQEPLIDQFEDDSEPDNE